MTRPFIGAALILAGCAAPSPAPGPNTVPAGKRLDIRLCLSQDTPKRRLAAAIRHRFYAERRPPFKRVHLMPPGGLTRYCDVVAVIKSGDVDNATHAAEARSVYSEEILFTAAATGTVAGAAQSLGEQLFAAFDRGTALHDRIISERRAVREGSRGP